MPISLNPRVTEKIQALPDGPVKDFLTDLMTYENASNTGERSERGYKDEILKLVDKRITKPKV